MDADPIHDRALIRLDVALRYAVARVEVDPHNVDAIVRHLGWDGHPTDVGHQPDQPVDLARERAKHAAHRTIEQLREGGFVPDAVERALSLLERSLPLLDREACEALMNAKLCFTRLSCEALLAAAQCFRPKSPFEIVRLGPSVGLVKAGTAAGLAQLANAKRHPTR